MYATLKSPFSFVSIATEALRKIENSLFNGFLICFLWPQWHKIDTLQGDFTADIDFKLVPNF